MTAELEASARAFVERIPPELLGPTMLEWRRNMRALWLSRNVQLIYGAQAMFQQLDRVVRELARKELNAAQG